MTTFQKRAVAVMAYTYLNEFRRYSDDIITGRYVDVTYRDSGYKTTIVVKKLSWDSIELEDYQTKFKFYDEIIDNNGIKLISQDEPYKPVWLYEVGTSSLRGKDWEGNWFEATVPSYRTVKLTAGSRQSDYFYTLNW